MKKVLLAVLLVVFAGESHAGRYGGGFRSSSISRPSVSRPSIRPTPSVSRPAPTSKKIVNVNKTTVVQQTVVNHSTPQSSGLGHALMGAAGGAFLMNMWNNSHSQPQQQQLPYCTEQVKVNCIQPAQ